MTHAPWWDIAAVAAIGLVCLGMMTHRARRFFGTRSGGGCCGCSKGCGATPSDRPPSQCQ